MIRSSRLFQSVFILLILTTFVAGQIPITSKEWPPKGIDGIGVNAHLLNANKDNIGWYNRQLDQIADMGLRVVRFVVGWRWTDEEKFEYDFEPHHLLVNECEKRGLRVMTLVHFTDPRFEQGMSVRSAEGRASFANFCRRLVTEFKGKGIIWELWNEPNVETFWTPWNQKTNAQEYATAANLAMKAMREVEQDCIIIGPNCSSFDMPFLESCFQLGLLEQLSAVSIHPYCDVPEWNLTRYLHLQDLINQYCEKPRSELFIVNSEMGFARMFENLGRRIRTEEEQAALIVRSILVDLIVSIPVHIIFHNYDYYAFDANKWEKSHYGLLTNQGKPKAAYYAVKTLTQQLAGLEFAGILESGNMKIFERLPENHVIRFDGATKTTLVAWTSQKAHPARIQIPGIPDEMVSMKGNKLPLPKELGNLREHLGRKTILRLKPEPIYIRIPKESLD